MTIFERFMSLVEPFLSLATSHPKRWLLLISGLTVGWIIATSLTALGMYMLSCHRHYIAPSHQSGGHDCEINWSDGEANIILVVGALLNLSLLVIVLFLLIREKLIRIAREDPPPDYETLIKSETPPPNYEELEASSSYVAEVNVSPSSAVPDTTICDTANLPSTASSSQAPLVTINISSELPPPSYSELFLKYPVAEILPETSFKVVPVHSFMKWTAPAVES